MAASGVIGLIFARGGSKGVPRKNLRPLAGKPLLAWAIECGLNCGLVDRVVVSTEDAEIAEVARRWGAETPFMRPAELAADDAPEWLAWRHAITSLRALPGYEPFTAMASIPATSPLREPQDLVNCVQALLTSDADAVVTMRPAARNPYFSQVVRQEDGLVRLVIPPQDAVVRRQDAPAIFDLTTVAYAARPDFVLSAPNLMSGRVRAVEVPEERAIDIDSELDFYLAECLMRRRLGEA